MTTERAVVWLNGTLVLPDRTLEDGAVICRQGRIQAVGRRQELSLSEEALTVDAGGGYIAPGYVDLHVHGGDGADFMDGTPDAARTAIRAHTRHGTTTIFPTTTIGSPQQIAAMLESCLEVRRQWHAAEGARIAGVHFYGPYFAADKVGCHLLSGRRDPTPEEYLLAFDLDIIRIATCAAELPGAEAFYREAHKRGCLVTCGHSNASWTEMARGFEAGLRHVDHFWCAMSSVPSIRERFGTPMQGSMEQFVLMHPEMSTEVIADGCHLSPELLEYAFVMKGPARLCLVTDANRALGMPPGEYRFGPQEDGEWFTSDGRVGFQPGRGLASSIVGMEVMVRNMAAMTRASVVEAVRMGSLTPAERAGIAAEVGSLEVGKRADVLVLNKALEVQRVFVAGAEFDRTRTT
ncbi:MAG TPA: amidohydrolase family protein [Chthonomonadaceae bacterium]|nr:amidohydrolase family protein [Chthonomonadaceae bacterium]